MRPWRSAPFIGKKFSIHFTLQKKNKLSAEFVKNPINYSVLRSKFQLENLNVLLIIQVVVAQLVSIEF